MKRKVINSIIAVGISAALAVPVFAGEIQKRQENQQDRIAQGVASGQLTPQETISLEKKEVKINNEIKDMREDNGGKLTTRERALVNRQLNATSRAIYRDKHNRRHS